MMSIQIKDLNLKFSAKQYLFKDLNLDIKSGEFACLLGASGSGKSTLLNILAGFNTDYSGQVYCDGKLVKTPSIERAVVFQDYALFPWLNVIENVSFGLKYKIKKQSERFMLASRYLAMVNLLKHARSPIKDLSGGMQQRVAIARALAVEPSLLLLDEPLGALDESSRRNLQNELKRIWQKLKQTTVLITHSVDEALLLSSQRILVLTNKDCEGALSKVIEFELDDWQERDLNSNFMLELRAKINKLL